MYSLFLQIFHFKLCKYKINFKVISEKNLNDKKNNLTQ